MTSLSDSAAEETSASADPGSFMRSDTAAWKLALADVYRGWRLRSLWLAAGQQDVKRRYRRSYLGPLWITLSIGILVVALGNLYAEIMGRSREAYIPHLALGFVMWNFMSAAINDGGSVFIKGKSWLLNVPVPISLFVFQHTWQLTLTFAHNALVYIPIAVYYRIDAGATAAWAIPGFILVLLNAGWSTLLAGLLCARFRDLQPILQTCMRLAFFATPVIWMRSQLGGRAYLADFNPFAYFLELVRAPLLGEAPAPDTWAITAAITVVGYSVTALVFVKARSRLTYWL